MLEKYGNAAIGQSLAKFGSIHTNFKFGGQTLPTGHSSDDSLPTHRAWFWNFSFVLVLEWLPAPRPIICYLFGDPPPRPNWSKCCRTRLHLGFSAKFQLARWSHRVALFSGLNHPPNHPPPKFESLGSHHLLSWQIPSNGICSAPPPLYF